eukprot:Protomagalhaensia_wolfi_Nauph_80__735@NODE_141_length_3460_cov_54_041216_g105_i0_p1_GENE_NODE_141_length_3460_cov_54_041216_g105_i0NODE_141_length_3460_cov_54_041216_g105_i0_p1_ORF_typecomplete_len355_score25_02Ubox/PF04564_15/1_4e04Ubox/PF04564_15/7_7e18zfNse/PF11789_8/6e05SAGATad1/PF12767_7/0_14zfC3HC4_2/PF13923_6/0_058zfC3HC4_4/PF15227_6/0_25Podoplanin/PF05808_11/0_75_NODE_141_length_3460_cov_54_041216_g105_i02061270
MDNDFRLPTLSGEAKVRAEALALENRIAKKIAVEAQEAHKKRLTELVAHEHRIRQLIDEHRMIAETIAIENRITESLANEMDVAYRRYLFKYVAHKTELEELIQEANYLLQNADAHNVFSTKPTKEEILLKQHLTFHARRSAAVKVKERPKLQDYYPMWTETTLCSKDSTTRSMPSRAKSMWYMPKSERSVTKSADSTSRSNESTTRSATSTTTKSSESISRSNSSAHCSNDAEHVREDCQIYGAKVDALITGGNSVASLMAAKSDKVRSIAIPDSIVCPISMDLMRDPVVLVSSGKTYERSVIEKHLRGLRESRSPLLDPITKVSVSGELTPNTSLRNAISGFVEKYPWTKSP